MKIGLSQPLTNKNISFCAHEKEFLESLAYFCEGPFNVEKSYTMELWAESVDKNDNNVREALNKALKSQSLSTVQVRNIKEVQEIIDNNDT